MAKLGLNGTTFEYVEQGAGERVVFVHGSAGDYRTWQSQLDALGRQCRAIAYSRRYHWPDARIAEGMDYAITREQATAEFQRVVSDAEHPHHAAWHRGLTTAHDYVDGIYKRIAGGEAQVSLGLRLGRLRPRRRRRMPKARSFAPLLIRHWRNAALRWRQLPPTAKSYFLVPKMKPR